MMNKPQRFTTPTGESFTTANYTVKSNPSTGTTILRAMHNGQSATKMVRGNPDHLDDPFVAEAGTTIYDEDVQMNLDTDVVLDDTDIDAGEVTFVNPVTPGEGIITAVAGTPWQALRLVRGSERGGLLSPFNRALERLGVRAADFRGTHLVKLVDAKTWQQYIDNMTDADVGAELNAAVSIEDRAIAFHFVKSLDLDRDHSQLLRRCEGNTQADTMAKAGIVRRLLTNGFRFHQNLDIATTRFDRMYKLIVDIIRSLRIQSYNYYELPRVRQHENAQIHQAVMTRYVPPTQEEVAVVEEMRRMTLAQGRNYAFRTTNNNHDPMGAFEMMLAIISSFENGDIRSMRTNLDILFKPPFNYKPEVGYAGMFDPSSPEYAGHQPLLVIFKPNKNSPPEQHYMLFNEALAAARKKDGQLDLKRIPDGVYTEVTSATNATPISRWMKKGDKQLVQISEEEFQAMTRQADFADTQDDRQRRGSQRILDEKRRDSENRTQGRGSGRRGGGGGGRSGGRPPRPERGRDMDPGGGRYSDAAPARTNPPAAVANPGYGGEVSLGRGKFLYVQLLPKTQVTFSKKLTDEERKLGKTQGERTLGLTKLVPPKESYGGVFVHTGKHKELGTEVPWLIRLPTTHFRAVNTNVDGKNVRTIGLMKGSKQLQDAWAKFGDEYGMPVFNSTKSLPTRFIIPKKYRGAYYDKLQRKIGKSRGKKA